MGPGAVVWGQAADRTRFAEQPKGDRCLHGMLPYRAGSNKSQAAMQLGFHCFTDPP